MELITAKDIGEKLEKEYSDNDCRPIDYFWIMVSKRDETFDEYELDDVVEKSVADSAEGWEWYKLKDAVLCGKHTMYFVRYDKKDGWNEQDREREINKEVRLLIKDEMELSVIIMRACLYTSNI